MGAEHPPGAWLRHPADASRKIPVLPPLRRDDEYLGLASGPPGGRRAASALNRATWTVCHTGHDRRQSSRRAYRTTMPHEPPLPSEHPLNHVESGRARHRQRATKADPPDTRTAPRTPRTPLPAPHSPTSPATTRHPSPQAPRRPPQPAAAPRRSPAPSPAPPAAARPALRPLQQEAPVRPKSYGRFAEPWGSYALLGATGLPRSTTYLLILVTWPAPTVRPPSRMANFRPSSMATGWISSTDISVLSPGMTISVPSGRVTTPVTSVVRK